MRDAQALLPNRYSKTWMELFLVEADADQMDREIAFLQRVLPRPNLTFAVADMRELQALPGPFDVVICWQSFGYFDPATNATILEQIATKLRPGGCLVLGIYNRDFFEQHQGIWSSIRNGTMTVTHQHMQGDRLVVDLEYVERQERERFDWQLFTPASIGRLASARGLDVVVACSQFNEQEGASENQPRMQLVFEKR